MTILDPYNLPTDCLTASLICLVQCADCFLFGAVVPLILAVNFSDADSLVSSINPCLKCCHIFLVVVILLKDLFLLIYRLSYGYFLVKGLASKTSDYTRF